MKLNVHEFGQGSVRGLWLHGWMGSGREGDDLQKALGNAHALCCPDLPGHGGTPLADWDLDASLEAVASLAQNCDWAGGYSMGGRILMMAANRYPDAFSQLVIESASLGLENVNARETRKKVDHQRAEELISRGLETFCETWYQMDMWGGFTDFPNREGDAVDLAGALELFSVAHQPDLRLWILNSSCRLLWLAGQKDPVYAAQADWVKQNTPHEVEIFDTGHNVHAQAKNAWGNTVCGVLKASDSGL